MDGVKEEYTSLRHTSTQVIQIDMQERTHIQKRNEEPLLGNPSNNNTLCFYVHYAQIPSFRTVIHILFMIHSWTSKTSGL